ncbi:hypothetical protein LCGC14_0476240 [marine sediment metagenome]|uniref:Uncharacterized protein n=1 Tax=marine sediment metagenome TaxID=412755 RepID=A0A0F9UXK4_9ZZZZ
MAKKKQQTYSFLETILNMFVFGFFGSVAIVLTRFFQSYLQELPLLFEIFYIVGLGYFLVLTFSINWGGKLKMLIKSGGI